MTGPVETGYVIMMPNAEGVNTYFRGCGRCSPDKWAKSIRSAQVYKSIHNATKSIADSNKIAEYECKYCKVLKVTMTVEEC